jgi:hypothetical protein
MRSPSVSENFVVSTIPVTTSISTSYQGCKQMKQQAQRLPVAMLSRAGYALNNRAETVILSSLCRRWWTLHLRLKLVARHLAGRMRRIMSCTPVSVKYPERNRKKRDTRATANTGQCLMRTAGRYDSPGLSCLSDFQHHRANPITSWMAGARESDQLVGTIASDQLYLEAPSDLKYL